MAVDDDLARVRRPEADDRLDELRLPVALDAGERDDLARPDLEADALDGHVVPVVPHVEVLDGQHHVARRRRALDDLELHVPADHQVREDLARRVLGLDRAGDASAAQHRDPVRDLQHLVELVGDEDDGGAGLGQAADDPEQLLRLEGRQDGGRLVQHEDVALAVERLEDLHPLAHADGEVLDLGVRVDVEVVLLAQLDHPGAGGLAIERADRPADALGAQRHRLDDVEDRDELEVLVDHADAGVDRLPRVGEGAGRPVDQDLARVGLVQARQDVHQGALAGTVLAQQAEDLPAVSGDGDPVVGEDAREALGDVLQLEAHRRLPSLVMQPARPREPRTGGQ